MTQEDVKDWLTINCNCSIYKTRQKEEGTFYSIRNENGSNPKKIVIVYPVRTGVYKKGAVKDICNQLEVQVPDYAAVQ